MRQEKIQSKEGIQKGKRRTIYEIPQLEHFSRLFSLDQGKLLSDICRRPGHYKETLLDLKNSLIYCFEEKGLWNLNLPPQHFYENKQGEFLDKTEELLSQLYGKIPQELNNDVKDMIEMILNHYAENKKYYAKRGEKQREEALQDLLGETGLEAPVDK